MLLWLGADRYIAAPKDRLAAAAVVLRTSLLLLAMPRTPCPAAQAGWSRNKQHAARAVDLCIDCLICWAADLLILLCSFFFSPACWVELDSLQINVNVNVAV